MTEEPAREHMTIGPGDVGALTPTDLGLTPSAEAAPAAPPVAATGGGSIDYHGSGQVLGGRVELVGTGWITYPPETGLAPVPFTLRSEPFDAATFGQAPVTVTLESAPIIPAEGTP
jgi:hypothetical protein